MRLDDLYAIERSSSVSGGLWEIVPESSVISVNQGLCTSFPFRLVKKEDGSSVRDVVLEDEESIPLLRLAVVAKVLWKYVGGRRGLC